MTSVRATTSAVARKGNIPTQLRTPLGTTTDPLKGPGYHEANRSALGGFAEPAAMNERPFMSWKDTFRSNMGYRTWDSDNRVMLSPRHGFIPPMRTPNMALGKIRAKRALNISEHGEMHFNSQVPGRHPTNPAASQGVKMLSHKWIPLEMSGDGILYLHPTSREVLEWGQQQLKADAKENGEDPDAELMDGIDDVLQHDPIQPYHALANQRKQIHHDIRDNIIRQEMRLHERRRQKGLPVPPVVMPQYQHEYPDSPGEDNKVERRSYVMVSGTRMESRGNIMGAITARHDFQKIDKRSKAYVAELEKQGVTVPRMYKPMGNKDQYQTAVDRNLKLKGTEPLEATIVSNNDNEDEEEHEGSS
eukprot:TRINITY_DN3726_c0_g1_i1.p1 TRINITY_DN3726_c0_g1~~TRINITY_DN3726_c0_g1_i1.p1  ORF type:complete len:361 (+),score=59.35 TRINITY_DN3726_c0_g1_i1:76-1158(+)